LRGGDAYRQLGKKLTPSGTDGEDGWVSRLDRESARRGEATAKLVRDPASAGSFRLLLWKSNPLNPVSFAV
jgi:hypothetical protein